MVELTQMEYNIYRKIDVIKDPISIERALKLPHCSIYYHLRKLINKGAITRTGSGNKAIYTINKIKINVTFDNNYEVNKDFMGPDLLLIKSDPSHLTKEQMEFIKNNYETMKRTKLAKMMGIPKVQLLLAIDQMPKKIKRELE